MLDYMNKYERRHEELMQQLALLGEYKTSERPQEPRTHADNISKAAPAEDIDMSTDREAI